MCATALASTVIRVIIWLNGTYGVGKTSTAQRLAAMVTDSRLFDPEVVGTLLRASLSEQYIGDFQDWAAWPPLVAASLIEISRMTGQHLIVPQTILKREYLEQIFGLLRAAELDVFHVVMDAADAVLRSRFETIDGSQDWRLTHLDEYLAARSWLTDTADFVTDTAASTPPQIARRIFAALPDRADLADRPDLEDPQATPAPAAAPAAVAPATAGAATAGAATAGAAAGASAPAASSAEAAGTAPTSAAATATTSAAATSAPTAGAAGGGAASTGAKSGTGAAKPSVAQPRAGLQEKPRVAGTPGRADRH
jgi:chloramphenicol 3-O-phosphotransferase